MLGEEGRVEGENVKRGGGEGREDVRGGRGECEGRRGEGNVEVWRLFRTFGFTSFKGCFSWR